MGGRPSMADENGDMRMEDSFALCDADVDPSTSQAYLEAEYCVHGDVTAAVYEKQCSSATWLQESQLDLGMQSECLPSLHRLMESNIQCQSWSTFGRISAHLQPANKVTVSHFGAPGSFRAIATHLVESSGGVQRKQQRTGHAGDRCEEIAYHFECYKVYQMQMVHRGFVNIGSVAKSAALQVHEIFRDAGIRPELRFNDGA